MPYVTALADFREEVRKVALEGKSEFLQYTSDFSQWI